MSPAVLLGIDTSAGLSVAVAGDRRRAERTETRPTVHAEQLSGLVEATCREAGIGVRDLTGVVVGTGPAPFTGLRVGLMTARVLADALGVPVWGVCSLDVLASQVLTTADPPAAGTEFVVATDARRREVYWARYRVSDPETCVRFAGPGVAAPATLAAELEASAVDGRRSGVHGPGTSLYPEVLGAARGPAAVSAAAMLAGVPRGLAVTTPEPLYLRRPDVSPAVAVAR